MDSLDVIKKAEALGGQKRRQAILDLIIYARDMGCQLRIGGGTVGGFNLRFGSIGHAIMDVKADGVVKVYVDPHPGHPAPNELWHKLNDCIDDSADMNPKTFPIQTYGELLSPIEEIPQEQLRHFIDEAVSGIWETYYEPYLSA